MTPGVWHGAHSLQKDETVLKHKLAPGLVSRTIRFGRPYAGTLAFFLTLVVLDAATGVINPLIYRQLINHGILGGNEHLIVQLALLAAGVSIVDSGLTFWQRQIAARVGLDILLDLRTQVFVHIQQMSLAFFTRARTGALVSRLNTDLSGVRDAFTDILSTAIGNLVTVTLVLGAMFALSWRLTLFTLILVPIFLIPARYAGRRLRVLTRETYDRVAEMNNLMIERFNVAGAMVAKIFGRPDDEKDSFVRQASRFRDWVTADGSSEFAAEAGRYHLYVSLACPWAHRAVILRSLKGLEDVIGLSILSGAHNTICPRLMELLREKEMTDVTVLIGGIIPEADIAGLKQAGIAEVFLPGTTTQAIVDFIRQRVVTAPSEA